ncbi:MAG TPA: hypothetical protein VMS78_04340 [Rhizomicrobium sp.]|nr:hypothetical protein [Rhizomicrobium sp.]
MLFVAKVLASLLVFAAVYFISYWLLFAQVLPENPPSLATGCAFLTAAGLAALFWYGASVGSGTFATAMTWAGIVGAIGFAGGFFGPMIFSPEANQGPLLGLFITGPLGFVAGGVAGLIYALSRRRLARSY